MLAALVALALAATRAAAQPGDFDDDLDSERPGDDDFSDDDYAEQAETNLTGLGTADGPAEPRSEAPPLSAVVAATLRAAGLADDPVPGWRTRSRWSALVPAITSRVGNSQSWREVTDPTVNRALSYDVRVSWRLERLIYDPNEPRFTAFDIRRRREKRHLTALATHAYFVWLRATAGKSPSPRALIQAARAQAELDALTDGWFSQALDDNAANPARSR